MAQKSLQQQFPVDRQTVIDDEWLRALLGVLESRIGGIEGKAADFDSAVDELLGVGLSRINETLIPALERVRDLSELGFLLAKSQTPALLLENAVTVFSMTEGPQRDLFTPSTFTILTRDVSPTDYAIMRTQSYNQETGDYVGQMIVVNGGPGPFNDWTIAAVAGSTIAQMNLAIETKSARDEAVASAGVAVSAKEDSQDSAEAAAAFADAANASKTAAATSASSATASKNAAANSATLADNYANKAVDQEVVAGKYSAKHWAQKAADALGGVNTSISGLTAQQAIMSGWIDQLRSNVSILALEAADARGMRLGMTGSISDAFDDTTGVMAQSGGLDDNTLLLISANGANGSTAFVDSSFYGRRVTPNGDAKISTAQSKFGGSSAAFDGTGDFLVVPPSKDMDLGTGDFTFDFWANLTAINQPYAAIFAMNWSAAGSFFCSFVSGKLSFYFSNAGIKLQEQVALAANTWTHYAIVRKDGVMTMYKNGIAQSSVTDTQSATSAGQPLYVGSGGTTDSVFNGFIDEFRMSNVARWTDNFTPPSSGYTINTSENQNAAYDAVNDNFRGSIADPVTRCLLHFDGANGSKKIIDEVGARVWTASGDAQISTAQSKFGGSCLAFDGTGDWIETTDFSDFRFGLGDFTMEFFARTATPASSQTIFEGRTGDNDGVPVISISSSKFTFICNGVVRIAGATTVLADTWYHVALSRFNGTTRLFVNGVLDGQFVDPTFNYGINKSRIGASYNGASPFNGFLDEFRISQVGRYTANFAAPTAPFDYKRKPLTIVSQIATAASVPTSGRIVLQTVEAEAIAINTDIVVELSRNGGVNRSAATLSLVSDLYGVKTYEGSVDLSGQPPGTAMQYRVTTPTGKNVAISGVGAQWR